MLKILVVDDEILVRIGIRSFLPWEQYGFQIWAEASNGKEALELCKQEQPDVIFTDIRMPVMDGLELMQLVKQSYPEIRLVVLSCLDETDYVKKSMLAGASGFFTKISLEQAQITTLLERLKKEILATKEKSEELERLKSYIANHKLSFNKQLLEHLIRLTNEVSRQSYVENLAQAAGLSHYLDLNRFLAIHVEHWNGISDQQTFAYNLFHYLSTLLPHIVSPYELFPGYQFYFIGYCATGGDTDSHLESLLHDGLKTYFNIDCKILPRTDMPLCRLPGFYQSLLIARDKIPDAANSNTYLDSIMKAVECKDTQAAVFALNHLKNSSSSTWKFKNAMIELLFQYEKNFRRYEESLDNYFGQCFVNSIIDIEDKEELYSQMCRLTVQIPEILTKFKENQYGTVIGTVTGYIDLHYSERLTLDYAARLASMNSSYFSRLFKKHAGMGFVEYLTNRRIEASKQLLLSGSAKLAEISDLVGFDDVSYFSKVFKKKTGQSPSEYREHR